MTDGKSSFVCCFFSTSFIVKTDKTNVIITKGSNIQCKERQSKKSMIIPEIDGALAGATFTTAPKSPIPKPLRSCGNTVNNIVCTKGKIIPAPIAVKILDKISIKKFGENPPMMVPMNKHEREKTTRDLDENILDKNPVIGIKIMVVSKNAVVSHCTCVKFKLNSLIIVG